MGKYIYCIIVVDNEQKDFESLGLNEAKLHTICFKKIGAVVSDSPIIKYSVSRENTIAHEKVIEEVMEEYTVLPVRFATIAEDENKVKKILEKEYDKFVNLLKNIEGKKELGIKAMFKKDAIYKDILEKYEDIRVLKEKLAPLPPEKVRYQLMEVGKMVEDALKKEKEIYREDITNTLSPIALEIKNNDTYGDVMILNSAFLVEEHREPEFDRKVHELDAKYGDKIKFKYVNKVPPFNFVNLVIETTKY